MKVCSILRTHRLQRARSSNPIQPQNIIFSLGRLAGAIHVSAPAKAQSPSKGCSWPGSPNAGLLSGIKQSHWRMLTVVALKAQHTAPAEQGHGSARNPSARLWAGGLASHSKAPRTSPCSIPGLAQPPQLPKPANSQGEIWQSSRQLLDHYYQQCPPLIADGRIFCFSLYL